MGKYTRNLPAPTDSFYLDVTSGKMFFFPEGTIGISASFAATASLYELSMSANTNNLHTPTDGTSSYVYFSASGAMLGPDSTFGLYWARTGSQHQTRIIPNHNSSSRNSGYGSLGGKFFSFTASAHTPRKKFYKVVFTNPESRVAATSSNIVFSSHPSASFSSSQGYIFQITGSDTTSIYNLKTTSSRNGGDYSTPYSSSTEGGKTITTIPFFYQYSASAAVLAGAGGNSSSAKDGVRNLLNVINENKDTLGVSASFTSNNGLSFKLTSTSSFILPHPISFVTKSIHGSKTKIFNIEGARHITSSQPSGDNIIQVPINFTASRYLVATASARAINQTSSAAPFVSASISGSENDFYGLILTNKLEKSVGLVSDIGGAGITASVLRSGSSVPAVPDFSGSHANPSPPNTVIPIIVNNNDDVATMVTKSVEQINLYFTEEANTGKYIPITASFSSSGKSSLLIESSYGFLMNPPTSSDARTITMSVVRTGSGEPGTSLNGPTFGQPDFKSASAHLLLDPDDGTSFFISGSNTSASLYFSGSGRMGLGTKNPKSAFDVKANDFKIRSRDGKRELKFDGDGRLSTKLFANQAASESLGGTLLLTYSPGTFENPTPAQTGETIGSIIFVDESLNTIDKFQGSGSAAKITSTVRGTSPLGGGGLIGDLQFKLNLDSSTSSSLVSFLNMGPHLALQNNFAVHFPFSVSMSQNLVVGGFISSSDIRGVTSAKVTTVDTGDDNDTYFPLLATNAVGDSTFETDSELFYNALTNFLNVDFVGSGNGWIKGTFFTGSEVRVGSITASKRQGGSGDISASGTLIGGGLDITGTTTFNDGNITNVGIIDVDQVRADADATTLIAVGNENIANTVGGVNTMIQTPSSIQLGTISNDMHVTMSGNLSASGGNITGFTSMSISYITASIVDVDGDTIRMGGEPFTKANIQALKQGRSLKAVRPGRDKPDLEADTGIFDSHITSSGNISASGTVIASGLSIDAGTNFLAGNRFGVSDSEFDFRDADVRVQQSIITTNLTASGNISASGNFIGNNIGPGIYDNRIYLTPADFYAQEVAQSTRNDMGFIFANGGVIVDAGRRLKYYAQKVIPKGYEATHVLVKGSDSTNNCTVFSSSFTENTAGQVGAAGTVNTELNFTSSTIVGGGNGTYCSVQWTAGSGNDQIFGGYIQIRPV